jgi:hypothetical protein
MTIVTDLTNIKNSRFAQSFYKSEAFIATGRLAPLSEKWNATYPLPVKYPTRLRPPALSLPTSYGTVNPWSSPSFSSSASCLAAF